MSSSADRILDAAWQLIESEGPEAATMSAIARAVGVSRQAVYFHFPDRTSLLVALARHVDDQRDLDAWVTRIEGATGGADRLLLLAQMQSARNPLIATVARSIDGARRHDKAAAAAWREQTDDRRRQCDALVTSALIADGGVDSSWTRHDVTTLVWELTSFRVWDDLVNEAGMSHDQYVRLVVTAVLGALSQPFT